MISIGIPWTCLFFCIGLQVLSSLGPEISSLAPFTAPWNDCPLAVAQGDGSRWRAWVFHILESSGHLLSQPGKPLTHQQQTKCKCILRVLSPCGRFASRSCTPGGEMVLGWGGCTCPWSSEQRSWQENKRAILGSIRTGGQLLPLLPQVPTKPHLGICSHRLCLICATQACVSCYWQADCFPGCVPP